MAQSAGPHVQTGRAKRLGRGLEESRRLQGLAVHLTRRLVLREGRQEEAVCLFRLVSRLSGS